MKKIYIFYLFLFLVFIYNNLFAQWQPDVRLTNNSASSYTSLNNAWCIASSGNILHVIWYDNRDGNWEIYYKRSTDAGASWGADTRLTNNSAISEFPSITVSGSNLHVVWVDYRDGNDEIYYKRSTDGGVSWGADTRLTNNSANSRILSVSVFGQVVHVVWCDGRDGNFEIYYKRSTDGGVSWGADTRLTNNSADSYNPSVSVSGQVVHVVWYDERDGNWEIYYKRSTDAGVSWGADTRLTNNSANSYYPSVSVSGQVVHVLWSDNRDGNYEIYYRRSKDGGESWETDTRLTNNSANSYYPSVSVSGQVVHVVWHDNRDGNYEIYYKRSTDGGVNWGADTRLTNNSANSYYPSVSVSGSAVHVVWNDYRDGNYEIYYKRDTTGNPVGIININSEIPKEFSLGQNYPNPFNPTTKIKFEIRPPLTPLLSKEGTGVVLQIYDVLGCEVATLVNEELKPGSYEVDFDGSNYTSGVYYYTLQTQQFKQSKRMVLLR
jgi:hypothetical protein